MNLEKFEVEFSRKLTLELPGSTAQNKMAPAHRLQRDFYSDNIIEPLLGAVLILVFPKNGLLYTVLTMRHEYNGVHSRQISFPGGKFEIEDQSLENTAIRESYEEIGIDVNKIKILGELTNLYIPPSNFLVSPYVGITNEQPSYIIDSREVDKLIEIPIDVLLDERNKEVRMIKISDGRTVKGPCYIIGADFIWGATAMILSEFEEIYKQIN